MPFSGTVKKKHIIAEFVKFDPYQDYLVLHFIFGGSDTQHWSLNAAPYIVYRVAKEYKEKGFEYLDLGGNVLNSGCEFYKRTLTNNDGILKAYVGKAIRNEEIYNRLCEINGISQQDFFPAYREPVNVRESYAKD